MSRIKFLAGSIVAIIVAVLVIISIVDYTSPQLKSDEGITEKTISVEKSETDILTERDLATVNLSGNPTKIISFTSSHKDSQVMLSIVTEGAIPTQIKELSLSESAVSLGYAWLANSYGDTFFSGPGHLKGFLTIFQENGNFTQWSTSEVFISTKSNDESKFCLDVQTKLESKVSISDNIITVNTQPFFFDLSKESLFKAISFELIPDEHCESGFSLQPFDT